MVPLLGPLTGVVSTVNGVPSGSLSPASVKSPVAGPPSSDIVFESLSTTGSSFTGVTVIIRVSLTQITGNGNPLSQTLTIIVS